MSKTYELATKLANDLAEDHLASTIANMMVEDNKPMAKAIRELSESNTNQSNGQVQEYRSYQHVIYSVLYELIDGYGGYKLVKTSP